MTGAPDIGGRFRPAWLTAENAGWFCLNAEVFAQNGKGRNLRRSQPEQPFVSQTVFPARLIAFSCHSNTLSAQVYGCHVLHFVHARDLSRLPESLHYNLPPAETKNLSCEVRKMFALNHGR